MLTVPGSAFGDCGEGFVRATYATSMDNLMEAVRRMNGFVNKFWKLNYNMIKNADFKVIKFRTFISALYMPNRFSCPKAATKYIMAAAIKKTSWVYCSSFCVFQR